jgi:hypothetical protein
MGEVLAMILAAGGATGIFALVWSYGQASMKRLEEAWRQAATELGGKFTPAESGWLSSKPMSIGAVVEGVSVMIDHYTVSSGRSSTSYTRLRAQAETLHNFKLAIHQEGVFASLGKALGAQDVEVGDPRFDKAFIVKTNDEGLAKAWLAPHVTAAVWGWEGLAFPLPYSYRLEERVVVSTCVNIERMSARLAQVARATAALARRGAELRFAWNHLARDLEGIAEGEFWGDEDPRIETQARGSGVTIEVTHVPSRLLGKKLVTRVWGRRSGMVPDRFVAAEKGTLTDEDGAVVTLEEGSGAIEVRSSDPRVTRARFDRELTEALEAIASARVVGGGEEVAVVFDGLELAVPRLKSAVNLVAGLTAVDPAGPYR